MAIEKKESNIKQSFGNAGKYGVQGAKRDNDRDDKLQGAKGVQGHKTENEKSNDVAESVKTAFPDVAIVLPPQQFDDPQHKFEDPAPATTVQAGHGINISQVGNDYMVSVDVEEVFASDAAKSSITSSASLPFTASLTIDESEVASLSALGGSYQEGVTGEWITVPPFESSEGTHLYLVIEQDENRAITAVSLDIFSAAVDPVIEITPAAGLDPETAISYALVAEVIDGVLIQRRHGNFTIILTFDDGDFVRWPDTVVGSIPVPVTP